MNIIRDLHDPLHNQRNDAGLEWLVTNGLGGYASGTVSGVMTRRYHGMLVAALPAPMGRMVMLSHVQASVHVEGQQVILDPGFAGSAPVEGAVIAPLVDFRLEWGLPVWTYAAGDARIEKRVLMPYRQNTVHVTYCVIDGTRPVNIELRPFMHFRHYESPLSEAPIASYTLSAVDERFEVQAGSDLPTLRLAIHGTRSALTLESSQALSPYTEEKHRGYSYDGRVWSPGYFHLDLDPAPGCPKGTLIASAESWDVIGALAPEPALEAELSRRHLLLEQAIPEARSGPAAELVLAADQFIVTPVGRTEDAARAIAAGTEARTVIAGYHWFTDWGRDTMISLEGLTLLTGRHREAAFILRTFAHYVRDGLIPNMFPDGENEGLYHTADATLWFFHAIDRYVKATGDRELLATLLPTLEDILDHHFRGTHFGIAVDPADGLIRQGAEGYQLTWMDAKVDGWVVTPRRGKAVEINALFYNALRLMDEWTAQAGTGGALRLREHADRLHESFNARFWNDEGGYLYDLVDGDHVSADAACRPNQIFAISLTHPVLARERWAAVLDVVRTRLLTPFGLRSLAPGYPDYRPQYYGDLRARDAAYHQGTVWAWLFGPLVDAWRKAAPHEESDIAKMLDAFSEHLSDAGVGSVSEIFDAQSPYTPRGCIAQAWSVAELLRVWTSKPNPG